MTEQIFDGPDGLVMVDDGYEFTPAAATPPVPTAPVEQAPSERETSIKPEDVAWDEWHRRSDAVRTLAREFDEVDHGDIREFLVGRTTRELSDEEVGQIRHDVIGQRVSDIADIFDEQLRSTSERLKRSRRTVRVQAPRGWLRRAFNSLDERAVGQVAARLLQRGHDPDAIKEKVVSRHKDDEARQRLEDAIDKNELKIEFATGVLLSGGGQVPAVLDSMNPADIFLFATGMAETIAQNIRVPDVRVEVPVNVSGSSSRRVVRDENGLVTEIKDEPGGSSD